MRRDILLLTLLVPVALTAFFLAGYRLDGHQKTTDGLAAAIASQSGLVSTTTSSAVTSAESGAPTLTPTLADVLQELQDQELFLANQMTEIRTQLEIADLKTVFTRVMQRGDSGDDVSRLQELLQQIPEAYPAESDASSTVSGYYGRLTEAAVKRFQEKEGLKQTGVVDRDTRNHLYDFAANLTDYENPPPEFIDLSAVSDLKNFTNLQDQVSQLSLGLSNTQASVEDLQSQISQTNSDLSNIQTSVQGISNTPAEPLPGLSPTPTPTPTPTQTPASLPPLAISNVQTANITKTSLTVTWTTNNPSTGEVDYSQNSSMSANQTSATSSADSVTSHSLVLVSLNPGTKYYYRVISKDSSGGLASSTLSSFSTAH